jgi:hypothetical protein
MGYIELREPEYGFPTADLPFYKVKLSVGTEKAGRAKLASVKVNGVPTRDCHVYGGGRPSPVGEADFADSVRLVVRADWRNGSENMIEAEFLDEGGERHSASCVSRAPEWGGYWNAEWPYYSASVLTEEAGIDRVREPVHLLLGYYAERLTDPEREIRVVEVDPLSGVTKEIPSQVYGVSSAVSLKTDEGQPTTTLEVAFLADVPALTSKVYLVFYGNGRAEKPLYGTDLTVGGSGLGVTVDNSCYRAKTHPLSGQLDEFLLKQGVNVLFDHKIETNGALHWNPDLYAPPRVWTHASDWNPPTHHRMITGPVFCMTKRWGALPHYDDALCSITYVFYAHQPYMVMDSVIDILEPMDVRALRNGEIVINLNVADSFSWRQPDGTVRNVRFTDRPKEPRRALDIPDKSPWWAFTNLERRAALASIVLENGSALRSEGLARAEPYITLKWGPWAYCTNPLAYSYNSSNPQRLIHVPAGSSFTERLAFSPLRLGTEGGDCFDALNLLSDKLHAPLSVSEPWMEVDPRVPEPWGGNFPYPRS